MKLTQTDKAQNKKIKKMIYMSGRFAYCYHCVIVICFSPSQADHIKQFQ
jgi:hypothetical protein